MSPDTRQLLIDAKALIADPTHWLQNGAMRDKDGNPLNMIGDPKACCWCLTTAIRWCAQSIAWNPGPAMANSVRCYDGAINALGSILGTPTNMIDNRRKLQRYNDTHSHAEVMTLLDKVINL